MIGEPRTENGSTSANRDVEDEEVNYVLRKDNHLFLVLLQAGSTDLSPHYSGLQ